MQGAVATMATANVRRWGIGGPEPRTTPIHPSGMCRAEQDCQGGLFN